MEIEVIRELEQLAPLQAAWNRAVESSGFDSIFLSYEWFYAWARNFAPAGSLCVVIAREADAIRGIMPLLRERRRIGPWTQSVLRSMSNAHTCKYSPVLPKEGGSDVLEAMLGHLSRHGGWDLMELTHLPASSDSIPFIKRACGKVAFGMRDEIQMESPYVEIAGTWEDYLGARNGKVRKNWDYFERRMQKEGSVDLIEIAGGAGAEQAVIEAFEIEESSWKGAAGSAINRTSAAASFYLDLARAMGARDNFRLYFLSLNGARIAFDYCLPYRETFNVLKTGYNPAYAKNSPGRVLRKSVLRGLFHKGSHRTYDLLGARDAWKEEWTQTAQPLLRVRLYNRTPVAMARYAAGTFVDRSRETLRRHPALHAAAKRVWVGMKGLVHRPVPKPGAVGSRSQPESRSSPEDGQ
ncbi:MAG: GNAT family N-acetyltransferase [Gammaproteobacteria bacterium]|nr:GNAT family N-acetyltransferase [Gammaproteobacteria bacterium]